MILDETNIKGVFVLTPRMFHDARGYFFEAYTERELEAAIGYPIHFVQENESASTYGVVRGLHFQRPPYTQAKLVRVMQGRVLDVAVDLRVGSPTYGQHVAVELSEENKQTLFIPHGFAHGFSVLSPTARFVYKCDNYYAPQSEGGILWNSAQVDWQIPEADIILSEKDTKHPPLAECVSPFA